MNKSVYTGYSDQISSTNQAPIEKDKNGTIYLRISKSILKTLKRDKLDLLIVLIVLLLLAYNGYWNTVAFFGIIICTSLYLGWCVLIRYNKD